jgi:hypothetical protein
MDCTPTSSVHGLTIKGQAQSPAANWPWIRHNGAEAKLSLKKNLRKRPAGSVDAVVRASGMPCKDHGNKQQMSPFLSLSCTVISKQNSLWSIDENVGTRESGITWTWYLEDVPLPWCGKLQCSRHCTKRAKHPELQGWSVWLNRNRGGQKATALGVSGKKPRRYSRVMD